MKTNNITLKELKKVVDSRLKVEIFIYRQRGSFVKVYDSIVKIPNRYNNAIVEYVNYGDSLYNGIPMLLLDLKQ